VKGETLDDIEKEKEQKNRRSIRNGLLTAAGISAVSGIICIVRLVMELV